jgi:ABC-type multidrug transport system fused ATPase/permease subunit
METLKNNRATALWKSSRQAYGAYKWQIIILSVLGVLSGLLEAVGINAIIPVFSLITGESIAGTDFISQTIERLFTQLGIDFRLKYLLIFIAILFIGKAIVLLFSSYTKVKITSDYERKTRNNLLRKALSADWPHLLKHKIGYLETILMVDVHQSSLLLQSLSGLILFGTGLLMYVLVAINISYPLTLITLAFGALIFLVFKPLIYKKKLLARQAAKLNKEVAHFVNENIIGIKTVKSMAVSDQIVNKGKKYFYTFRQLMIKSHLLSAIANSVIQPLSFIFILVLFAFSYKSADFNMAAFVAIIYLIQRIFSYVGNLQTNFHKVSHHFPFLQEVLNYQQLADQDREKNDGKKNFVFNKELKLHNVSFAYDGQQNILDNTNLTIQKGQMVGLIGTSGSGKTTVVDLILRLLKPQKGQITLDGQDISDINLHSWRKNIGYVSQDIFLMNDTIANNIRFYDKSIGKAQMIEAAKMANIYDFIQETPGKFDTMIGERGVRLSVGQRQRIVIARILARQPKILLLDEATSALDNESELKIQKIIDDLKGKVTVVVIAHRLSTVMDCDQLSILDKGHIIEQGKPKDLLQDNKSRFYKLYNIRQ